MKTDHAPENLGFGLMLVAVASWAASFIWLKMALETLPPAGLAAIRFALASLV